MIPGGVTARFISSLQSIIGCHSEFPILSVFSHPKQKKVFPEIQMIGKSYVAFCTLWVHQKEGVKINTQDDLFTSTRKDSYIEVLLGLISFKSVSNFLHSANFDFFDFWLRQEP